MILAAWTRLDGGPADPGGAAARSPEAPPGEPIPAGSIPAILTPEEAARAAGFKRPARKAQYLAGHGLLRLLAGTVLGLAPERVRLPAEGRPRWEASPSPLWLSLGHSGPFAIAVASDEGPVGVDIERTDQERDWAGLAAGMGWGAPDKRGFLETWTLREAEFKAGLAEGTGKALRAERPEFYVTIVTISDSIVDWMGPGGPGLFREPTRPPRP
ncbi:MAG TPA: hypothetical protein VJ385_04395 [Fibrobacteria bacterium]|nr:hypothetical protein [Fibrobacteria bacterium]